MGPSFEPGRLHERIRAQSRHGLETGAMQPIATDAEVVEDSGIPFLARLLVGQKRKMEARARQRETRTNPFLPYDRDLFVADLSATHVCLLNKFNVVDDHVLVVTRDFEEQSTPLQVADLAAAWSVLREIDGLMFYNSGPAAGASQPHKHLQIVPLPLGDSGAPTPVDPTRPECAALPFAHAWAPLEIDPARTADDAGAYLRSRYAGLLESTGLGPQPGPNNVLMTRRWMMVVPRRGATHEGVIVNALGFAGTLLLRTPAELQTLRRLGPLRVLTGVAGLEASATV